MKRAMITAICFGLAAGPALSGEAGDAVFAERAPWTLDQDGIRWAVHVAGPRTQGFLPIENGSITLTEAIDPSDQKPILQITQKTDAASRKIGPFPISGGDPVLIFFLEQTARDMAKLTGGSPFYIRNRIKDAVFRGGEIVTEGATRTATFQPFRDDPNAQRMQGFDSLTLSFVLDDDPKAPIRQMTARTEGDTPGYENRMVLE